MVAAKLLGIVEWDTVADSNSGSVGSKLVEGGAISGTPFLRYRKWHCIKRGNILLCRIRAINDVPHQNIYSSMNYNWQLSLPFSAKPEDNGQTHRLALPIFIVGRFPKGNTNSTQRNGGSTISIQWSMIFSTFNSGVNGGATGSTDVAISSWSSIGGASLLHDITGLTAGVVYYVRVRAKNSVGYSSLSGLPSV